MSRRVRFPLAVVLLAVLAGACGGDDGNGDRGAGTTTEPSPSTTEAPPRDLAADRGLAAAALLEVGDLPEGWTVKEGPIGLDPHEYEALTEQVASCADGGIADVLGGDAGAIAEAFDGPSSESVIHAVGVATDDDAAESAFESLEAAGDSGCLADGFRALIEAQTANNENAEIGDVVVERRPATAARGDRSTGFHATMPVKTQGLEVEAHYELGVVQAGRMTSTILASTLLRAVDPARFDVLTTAAAGKLDPAG